MMAFEQAIHSQSLCKGVSTHLLHVPHLRVAHISLALQVGYLDEPSVHPGLAHLLEHVLMTSPLACSKGDDLISFIHSRHGRINANTEDRVTDFHASVPVSVLDVALEAMARQLAQPRIALDTIATEIKAIDAEFQARQNTAQIQRLAGLRALSLPGHSAAFCHHGNADTLRASVDLLRDAMIGFHQRYYTQPRLTVGILSSLPDVKMQYLAEKVADYFLAHNAASPSTPMRSSWGHQRYHCINADRKVTEWLWPADTWPAASASHLSAFAQHLDQGGLLGRLPPGINDYRVELAPQGASDTLQLICHGRCLNVADEGMLSNAVAQQWRTFSHKTPPPMLSIWQQSPSLAAPWWRWVRQQAVVAPLLSSASPKTSSIFCRSRLHCLAWQSAIETPPCKPTHKNTIDLPSDYPQHPIKRWVGRYEVEADASDLTHQNWVACYLPSVHVSLPPLTRQQLACKGVVLYEKHIQTGTSLVWLGASEKVAIACAGLFDTMQCLPSQPSGILAQTLISSLYQRPDSPAVWSSDVPPASALLPGVQRWERQRHTGEPWRVSHHCPDDEVGELAVMVIISLPATPANRYLAAFAERQQAGDFLHQVRHHYKLGYVAAIRHDDAVPFIRIGYVVQSSQHSGQSLVIALDDMITRLWESTFQVLDDQSTLPQTDAVITSPETPIGALELQWLQLLGGGEIPLHRLKTPWPPSEHDIKALKATVKCKDTREYRFLSSERQ